MPRIRSLFALFLSIGVIAAGPVQADDALRDRYIAATKDMGDNMVEMIRSCAPDIDTSGIDFEYTPRMKEAVACVIDTHIERFGRPATVELVEQAEAMSERSFTTLQEMTELQQDYPRLTDPAMMELNQSCGTVEASQDLPLNDLMRENMNRMAACFSGPN